MQVIVSGELDKELHVWLTSLTRDLDFSEAEMLVYQIGKLEEKEDRINASAVLNLVMNANQKVFEKVKGENPMFEELQKLMKPHTDKIVQEAVQEAVLENKVNDIEIMISKFGIPFEDACDAVQMSVEEFKKVKENRKEKAGNLVKEEAKKENTAD